jgi:NADPH:quinone reductase-like Zn-dependent oxidoreductase
MRGTPYFMRVTGTGFLRPKDTRLGVDLAGQVEAVGRNVTRFKPGDEVFGTGGGAFARYARASEKKLALKPANITFEQAAAVPVAALTALQGLRDKGKLQPGQKVLVNGASGGVGTFAVQIARALGADVTGVCSTRNLEMVRSLGAHRVIDYTREDFTKSGQRYDLILDCVGNQPLLPFRRALNPDGICVIIGGGGPRDGLWLGPLPRMVRALLLARFASQRFVPLLAEIRRDDLAFLGDLMQSGKVTPVIDRTFPLSQVPDAIRYLEKGHARGKVVITPGPADDAAPVSTGPAGAPANAIGPGLVILALVAVVVVPVVAALALDRRFRRRNPGTRPVRWGYYFSIVSIVAGLALGVLIGSGAGALIACGLVYAVLGWFFARRHPWAWIALTILSFNPVAWIVNAIYLWKRRAEDSIAAPAA